MESANKWAGCHGQVNNIISTYKLIIIVVTTITISLIVIGVVIYFMMRKKVKRNKIYYKVEHDTQFDNTGYTTVYNDVTYDTTTV